MTEMLPTTRWHRPLVVLGVIMLALTLVCIGGLALDPRTLLGVNVWEKPLKFAISTAIYAFTWSWLIGQLTRFRRLTWWAGTLSTGMLAVELAIIAGGAAVGVQTHFNVSTPLETTVWAVMATSVSVLWIATFVVSIVLFFNRLGDQARTIAIRAGAIIALVGMALAFLMTSPTAQQLADFQGIAGAHAVGVVDGGPGLPVLGWSTVAGDLRIPHFVGMHALQIIPLVAIAFELLARRIAVLRSGTVRGRMVLVAAIAYAGLLAVLTWQALRGQSIVQPDAATIAATSALALATLVALALVIARRPRVVVLADAAPADPALTTTP